MHYFLIAGEASGDLHASRLIEALKTADAEACFTFLGGDKMAAAAGVPPVIHYSKMAFMGFSEVLRNLGAISRNFAAAKRALNMSHPDALILIDYPSFNLKMAKVAAADIPVYYYISPKIWAWKKWRIADIKRYVRRMFCILPFETEFYARCGYTADYVGNPSPTEIDADMAAALPRQEFLTKYKLRDKAFIALMPGSRVSEIKNNLPVMRKAAYTFPQYRPLIIAAPAVRDEVYLQNGGQGLDIIKGENAAAVLAHCRAALVTSGTATLETALAGVPQVVCYRANGSKISYELMKRILDIDFVSLPNLILGREAVPEMLLHMCTPEAVADCLAPLLRIDNAVRNAQLAQYKDLREILGKGDAAANTARLILADLTL